MIEEHIVSKVEELHNQMMKMQNESDDNEISKIDQERRDNYIDSSYDYERNLDTLNSRERFHYEAMIFTAIAIHAIKDKVLHSRRAKLIIRKFLLNPQIKAIRESLYRKGDMSSGLSKGMLRNDSGKAGPLKSLVRNRAVKHQILSTGLSLKEYGIANESVVSDTLDKLITLSLHLEELSPGKVARTLSATNMLHSLRMRQGMNDYHISGRDMSAMGSYYGDMVNKYGKGRMLNPYDYNNGLFYSGGELFGSKIENGKIVKNIEDKIADGVIPVFTQTDVTGQQLDRNINQIFRKHLIEEGVSTTILDNYNRMTSTKKVSFVFGDNSLSPFGKLSKAYASKMFESGARALDMPFALISEEIESRLRKKSPSATKSVLESIYSIASPRFGSGTVSASGDRLLYDRKLVTQLYDVSKKVFGKGLMFSAAYYTLDQVSGNLFGEDYTPKMIAGNAIVNTQILYSKIFSDGIFGEIKDEQEKVMPNSTGVQPIIGVTASLGMIGSIASYGKGLYEKSKYGFAEAERRSGPKQLNINPIEDFLRSRGRNSLADSIVSTFDSLKTNRLLSGVMSNEYHRGTRWGVAGAIIGAAMSIPLIPGAIAGDDSETIKRQVSGVDKVEVKANRGWIFGGEAYEGGKTKYFDRHWFAKMKSNTEMKIMYGDRKTMEDMNPILNPFNYLADPYRFEKMHRDDMPFPVWGMDVTYGGFLGELFEGTIGKIIKPTVINNDLKSYLSEDNKANEYKTKKYVSDDELSLIKEGKMLAPIAPKDNTFVDPFKKSVLGFLDFSGLKGFFAQGVLSDTSYLSPLVSTSSLEVSGSAITAASQIKEANLGDALFLGETQRRIINTGADSLAGRKENPIKNKIAPSWLPNDKSEYYIDFSTGNYYGKVENGIYRLPGKGFEEFHTELKDVNPEYYPLINKYEVLADVALGSKEFYNTKRELTNKINRGDASEYEKNRAEEIESEIIERSKTKDFRDERDNGDVELGLFDSIGEKYWNTVSTIAQGPHEAITPLRFGSKFIHDRTSIEDYKKDRLYGNDMALWTRPISHFLQSAVYEAIDDIGGDEVPDETEKRRAIDEYFDKLEFIKQRRIYKNAIEHGDDESAKNAKVAYRKTRIGSIASGLNSEEDVMYARQSLEAKDREYFSSFSRMKDENKRNEILSMTSGDEGRIYTGIWKTYDSLENEQTEDEKQKIVNDSQDDTNRRLENADLESEEFVTNTLGMPEADFSGWDKRISMRDVKLRFLQIARENVRDYGFWRSDEIEMLRKTAILNSDEFLSKARTVDEDLVQKYNNREKAEFNIRNNMLINNIKAKKVEVREDGNGTFEFIEEKNQG